jgi:LacI family transcriptional regulator
LLSAGVGVTAVFAANNVLTAGAFGAVLDSGLRCPEDVSVLGFDDHEWSTLVRPQLTVVAQPAHELGVAAAATLLERVSTGTTSAPATTSLQPRLVVRGSVAAAPAD